MEPEAKYTLVGAAALILVALLAAAVMWLRSSGEGANAQPVQDLLRAALARRARAAQLRHDAGDEGGVGDGLPLLVDPEGRGRGLHLPRSGDPGPAAARPRRRSGTW